jgi:hypothetical protein
MGINTELSFQPDDSRRASSSLLLELRGKESGLAVDDDSNDSVDDDGDCPFFFGEPVPTNWD